MPDRATLNEARADRLAPGQLKGHRAKQATARQAAMPTSDWPTPQELGVSDALVRDVVSGHDVVVKPVLTPASASRILGTVKRLLSDRGFVVVTIDGGTDDALATAWSSIAAARRDAPRTEGLLPAVLIVYGSESLALDTLELLAATGGLAVVVAPIVSAKVLRQGLARRRLRMASNFVLPFLPLLAIALLFWMLPSPEVSPDMAIARARDHDWLNGRGAQDVDAASHPSPETVDATDRMPRRVPDGAPGMLLMAGPGDTLETLYRRVYRDLTPPPFDVVAAMNPQPVLPGVILTFPEPQEGWSPPSGKP